jgi:capsule assembly protein Wzi
MRLRRHIPFFILIIALLFWGLPIYANNENSQKIYETDSDVYIIIRDLTIEQGLGAPSSAGPWSDAELLGMLSRINPNTLSLSSKDLYNWIKEQLSVPEADSLTTNFGYTAGIEVIGESYLHTNTGTHYDEDDEWIDGYTKRDPLLKIPFEFWGTDLFYGTLDLTLGNNRFFTGTNSTSEFFKPAITTNLIFDRSASNIDLSFPRKAFLSVGDMNWNIQFGRDKISWGNGISGNLVVGDHLIYHEFFKFTTFYDPFKYTFLAISFPHPDLYQRPPSLPEEEPWSTTRRSITSIRTFIAHRFEFQITPPLRLSLTEGIMYQGETYDFRFFSPFVILHNYYMKENANSIFGIELDYTPFPSFLIHGQFVVDDLAIGSEKTSGSKASPNAWGALASLHYTKSIKSGMFHIGLEGVYTTPYLYLRNSRVFDDPTNEQDQNAQPINFVVGYPQYTQLVGNVVKKEFLGYSYGGDAIVLNLAASYIKPDLWEVHSSIFWMMHGTFDVDTLYELGDDPVSAQTPTDQSFSPSYTTDKNSVETTWISSIGGSYYITSNLKFSSDLGWIIRWNPGNIAAPTPENDLQGSISISLML